MSEYLVRWEMNFEADSPEQAAHQALAVHRNPESIAVFFEVTDEAGVVHKVDLLEE